MITVLATVATIESTAHIFWPVIPFLRYHRIILLVWAKKKNYLNICILVKCYKLQCFLIHKRKKQKKRIYLHNPIYQCNIHAIKKSLYQLNYHHPISVLVSINSIYMYNTYVYTCLSIKYYSSERSMYFIYFMFLLFLFLLYSTFIKKN